MLYVLAAFASLIATCLATKDGVDIAELTSVSTMQCMVSKGNSFAIPRVYRSVGQVDTNGPANIKNAWKAGFSEVGGYIFPCMDCSGGGAKPVADTVAYLQANGINSTNVGASIDTYWLDIELIEYWSLSKSTNIAYIQEMVDECTAQGIRCGIYTSKSQWSDIAGTCTLFGDLPLWYPHYDGQRNWDDFAPFGGWTIEDVEIKQYAGDMILCGVDADFNYVE